jgi:hypothetical protein
VQGLEQPCQSGQGLAWLSLSHEQVWGLLLTSGDLNNLFSSNTLFE